MHFICVKLKKDWLGKNRWVNPAKAASIRYKKYKKLTK